MIRYADPEVCPCCRLQIPRAAPRCEHCGTGLTGPVAQGLFRSLTQADTLVAQLTAPVAAPAAASAAPGSPGFAGPLSEPSFPAIPAFPAYPTAAREPRRSGLSAASIPRILLGLGATCLLVAAVVFLAVAWSDLGMGARTAILLALTAGAAGLTAGMARRGLPAGAEAFGTVFLGFLTLDVLGAQDAGWFGGLGDHGLLVLLGSVLAASGTATSVGVTRIGMRPLVGAQLVVAVGAALAASGATSLAGPDNAAVVVALVVALAALALGLHRLRLAVAAVATALLSGVWWIGLVGLSLERVDSGPTLAGVWGRLDGWPLLAAAALAASPVLVRSLPGLVRVSGAGVAVALVALVAVVPAADESTLTLVLVGLAVVAAGAALSVVTAGAWRWLPVVPTVTAGLGLAAQVLVLGGQALESLVTHDIWEIAATAHLQSPDVAPYWALLLPASVGAGLVALAVLARPVVDVPLRPAVAAVATAVALAVAVTPGMFDVPLWSALAVQVAVVGALGLGAVALGRTVAGTVAVAGAVALAPVVLATALANDRLTAAILLAGIVLAASGAYAGRGGVRLAGDLVLVPVAAGFVWTALHLAGGDQVWRAAPVVLLAGVLAIGRPAPEREAPAALAVLVAVPASIVTSTGVDQTWLAVHLTLAGALVTTSALLHPTRRALSHLGLALLTLATWVRLEQVDVDVVEAYTLPLAVVLAGIGTWRMLRDGTSSRRALSAGLGLGLGPSLLVVLVDPVSPRAVLLGLACLVLVMVGIGTRCAAPLVAGAAVGAALVLHEAQYAQVVPQWVLIGLVGTALTVVGVTWERRLADLRVAAGYVRRLR